MHISEAIIVQLKGLNEKETNRGTDIVTNARGLRHLIWIKSQPLGRLFAEAAPSGPRIVCAAGAPCNEVLGVIAECLSFKVRHIRL